MSWWRVVCVSSETYRNLSAHPVSSGILAQMDEKGDKPCPSGMVSVRNTRIPNTNRRRKGKEAASVPDTGSSSSRRRRLTLDGWLGNM